MRLAAQQFGQLALETVEQARVERRAVRLADRVQAPEQPLARRAQGAAAHDGFYRLQAQAVRRDFQRAAQRVKGRLRRLRAQIGTREEAAIILERADGQQVAVDQARKAVAVSAHQAGRDRRAAASSSRRGSPEASFFESDRVWRKPRAPGRFCIRPSMWRVMLLSFSRPASFSSCALIYGIIASSTCSRVFTGVSSP